MGHRAELAAGGWSIAPLSRHGADAEGRPGAPFRRKQHANGNAGTAASYDGGVQKEI